MEDGKYVTLTEEPQPVAFTPILQFPSSTTWLLTRSNGDPQRVSAAVRDVLHGLDAGLPVSARTWYQTMDTSFFPARVATLSLRTLGGLGAMLSVTGVFGMAAYSVSTRVREFGIRIALGRSEGSCCGWRWGGRSGCLRWVGREAAARAGGREGAGVRGVLATPWDPIVLGGVLATMLLLGLVAAWIPARRALGTDPLILLREE